jgi:serine/threonine protein kinase
MASRTSEPEATVSEGLDTRSIYYRRATISCSQGAFALPFDDASVVNPPSAFGTFRVLHQIGSGVLGPVFRSYDSQRERLAVIKAFKVDILPERLPEFAEALRAIVTRPVDDSSIVRAIDSGVEGATPFLALEFVSDDTLDAILRESRPVTRKQALALCAALGRAIDAAWAVGIGHGALHPRDVFVAESGEVAISGFGVAQALDGCRLARAGSTPILGAGARERRELGPTRRRVLARGHHTGVVGEERRAIGRGRCGSWNRRWPTTRRLGLAPPVSSSRLWRAPAL